MNRPHSQRRHLQRGWRCRRRLFRRKQPRESGHPKSAVKSLSPLLQICLLLLGSGAVAAPTTVFPGARWEEASPGSQGVDARKLEDATRLLAAAVGTNGVQEMVIVRHGRMIWKGDSIDRRHGVWSATKSFTSTVLGLLIEDGKCTLDTRLADVLPELDPHYPRATLRHFTTMTSGYRAVGDETTGSYKHGPSGTPFKPNPKPLFTPPGSQYAYWDSAMNTLGLALTRIAGEPMEALFRRRIAEPIGMKNWDWGDYATVDGLVVNGGSGNGNKHIFITAQEMARFGLLFLHQGNWNGRQILSKQWIAQATRVQVPASIPWAQPESDIDGRGLYGFNWWRNGLMADGEQKFPDAPEGMFWASGHNNNKCFVIPEWDMVIVRLGLDGQVKDDAWNRFFAALGKGLRTTDASRSGAMFHQRPRVIIETDAGGDPDDEQSLVRFLAYANEFDLEGIIANRATARERENANAVRDGLGIVRAQVEAYGKCYANLIQHDALFPAPEHLLSRTVAGYSDTDAGVRLIIRAVDAEDPRPVWFSNWGTDQGSAESCLKRALDQVLRERGSAGYATFKNRLRLSSADKFGDHTTKFEPSFPLWIDTFRPSLDNKRWYHRFSALTATAGGFDLQRDVRTGHGPLGALYPTNTNLRQKEGDTMAFLYFLPTGMNDVNEPAWGSWAGRYGPNEECAGKPYFWANQTDTLHGTMSRDHTLARWAADLQNDFRARMDWCVRPREQANHRPLAVVNQHAGSHILRLNERAGSRIELSAAGSSDPDGDKLTYQWFLYGEAGTYGREVPLSSPNGITAHLTAPRVEKPETIHIILRVGDNGDPVLCSYRRVVITVAP